MHEFIFIARLVARRIGTGIRTVKDADGVDGSAFVLHGLSSRNGIVGDRGAKVATSRGLAVCKEHNNLLGVFTSRSNPLGQLHAVIGTSGAIGLNGINRSLEALYATARARRQLLHCLRVVVEIALVGVVRIVADLIGLLARELHDGNLVLLARVLNVLVLLRNGVDKVVGSILERIDTLGRIFTTHRIIH